MENRFKGRIKLALGIIILIVCLSQLTLAENISNETAVVDMESTDPAKLDTEVASSWMDEKIWIPMSHSTGMDIGTLKNFAILILFALAMLWRGSIAGQSGVLSIVPYFLMFLILGLLFGFIKV